MRAIAYCEQDEDCQNLLRKRMSEGNLDTAPIFSDIIALCDALENPDKNRELANMASTVLGNRGSPNFDCLQGNFLLKKFDYNLMHILDIIIFKKCLQTCPCF